MTAGRYAAVLLVVASCGTAIPSRGHRTASDCERMVRHAIAVAGTTAPRQTIDAAVGGRCAEASTLAWLNDLDDHTYACLLRADSVADGDICLGHPQLATEWPPIVPASVCPAYRGAVDGRATVRGVVTHEGAPFNGATIEAHEGGDYDAASFPAVTISEVDGRYAFDEMRPGTYTLLVWVGALAVVVPCVEARDGGTTVDVKLPRSLVGNSLSLD